jgi:DNA repair exonuclease SbcCD ATPase subunit
MSNHKKFLRNVRKEYSDKKDIEIIIDSIEESLDRDSPQSVGKSLRVNKVNILGVKDDKSKIESNFKFEEGINVIIASNLRGKSSVFKIIKYALTGKSSLKKDVKSWIKSIELEFRINEKTYTIFMEQGTSLKCKMYLSTIEEFQSESFLDEPLLVTSGVDNYREEIQKFFFSNFSYYPLKWTSKPSAKGKIKLETSNMSWPSYFKSIYLESKDSIDFYGSQTKKRFEMLLGLDHTYIINKLTVMKEHKESEKSLEEGRSSPNSNYNNELYREKLLEKKNKLVEEIAFQNSYFERESKIKGYIEKQRLLLLKIETINDIKMNNDKELNRIQRKTKGNLEKISELKSEETRLGKEILKLKKRKNKLKEYLEVGMFFSNLDVQVCPSCNKNIDKSSASKTHCPVCHNDEVESFSNDHEAYENKLTVMEQDIERYIVEIKYIAAELINYESIINNLSEKKDSIEEVDCENVELLLQEYEALDTSISVEKKIVLSDASTLITLKEELAVVEYQLSKKHDENVAILTVGYDEEINFLEKAISYFEKERVDSSKNILNKLEKIMLEELNEIGLTSITEVKIEDNLNIKYYQNRNWVKFDDISEGEQLRVKLAFHLGLIRLDIEKNFGRHTRFLIVDSPNKEEADENYVLGLTSQLNELHSKYKDNIQIIIGTASREYEGVLSNELCFEKGAYVF